MKKLLGLFIFLWAGLAQATLVEWTLTDMTFTDGGTASGSFTWDSETNAITNVAISTTDTATWTGADYTLAVDRSDETLSIFAVTLLTGAPFLGLVYTSDLTSAGGTVFIRTEHALEAVCDQNCDVPEIFGPYRLFNEGSFITGSVVPVPAAAWLFGSALGLLGWFRRRAR